MSLWLQLTLPFFLEVPALAAVMYCVYRAQKNRIYPAFWQLLVFWISSDILLFAELFVRHLHLISGLHAYSVYFYTYWPAFAINAFLVLRVLHEMFRHAVRSIPGVQKLGRPIFFWAIAISVILAAAAGVTPHASGVTLLQASTQVLMRSEAVLALCMVTFLAFASHTLGVPFRSRIFGVTFGFALMGTANLVDSAIFTNIPSLAGAANLTLEIAIVASIAIWGVYFLRPEPARRLVTMPVTSPLMRWNEVAQTLGNPAGHVAVSYPPSFMTDVFELVNNVMGPEGWPQKAASGPPGPAVS